MKRDTPADPRLVERFNAYYRMPMGGPALMATADGKVSDGLLVIAQFKSKNSALRQLRKAKFLPTSRGWFIYTKANAINAGRLA